MKLLQKTTFCIIPFIANFTLCYGIETNEAHNTTTQASRSETLRESIPSHTLKAIIDFLITIEPFTEIEAHSQVFWTPEALSKINLFQAIQDVLEVLEGTYSDTALHSVVQHLLRLEASLYLITELNKNEAHTLRITSILLKNILEEDQAVIKADGTTETYLSFQNTVNALNTHALTILADNTHVPVIDDNCLQLLNTYLSWLIASAILFHYATYSFDITPEMQSATNESAGLLIASNKIIASRLALQISQPENNLNILEALYPTLSEDETPEVVDPSIIL
jgi:hypothetical protein